MIIVSALTILLILLVLFLIYFMLSFFTGAPFVASPMSIVKEMVKLGRLTQGDTIVDLGSGDGRILLEAAKQNAYAIGWEINPFLVFWTKLLAQINSVSNLVTVYCQTYHKANLQSADVVFLYNLPIRLAFIEKKMHKELKKGTKIISYKFPLTTFPLKKQTKSGIFLYTVS